VKQALPAIAMLFRDAGSSPTTPWSEAFEGVYL
jgi:hypothetical protein